MMPAILALAVVKGAAQGVPAVAPITAGTCGADDDGNTIHSEFKPNLEHRWCSTDKGTATSCAGTCCRGMDTCAGAHGGDVRGGGVNCKTAGHVYSKALDGAVTTKKEANVNCCEAEKKCDTFTCPSGWKDKAGKATTTCKNAPDYNVCTKLLCCVVETKTCDGQKAAWAAETNADNSPNPLECALGTEYDTTKAASAMGFDTAFGNWMDPNGAGCCKYPLTCGGQYAKHSYKCKAVAGNADYRDKYEHMYVTAGATAYTSNTENKWMDACCSTEVTKCSDYKCKADLALVSDPTKDNLKCLPGAGFGSSEVPDNFGPWPNGGEDACQATCCKKDPTKCRGYDTGDMHDDEKCDQKYDHEFKDDFANFDTLGMKMNNIVTDHSTYKAECCSLKLSCQGWKDGVAQIQQTAAEAQASAANRQYVLLAAPLLMALGMFA